MNVHFMTAYYSQWAHENLAPRTQKQWDAFKFCRAVKSARINGTMTFPWKKGPEIISPANVGRAREIFGSFIRQTLQDLSIEDAVLIPIPSKDGLIGAATFRSLNMLEDAVERFGRVRIAPVLRFTAQLRPANAGGPRGRYALLPYLTVDGRIPSGTPILVDDITTSGGSILASYDRLAECNRTPSAAIVCGQTVSDSLTAPFGKHQREIGIEDDVEDF